PSFGEYRISVRRTEPLEFSSGGDPSDRYALLVGVADYPGQENDLPAVAGDVRRMRDLLVNHFGFSEANIVVLEDDRATRENIVAAFTQHLAKAGGGGTALFYYSGHGTQLPENIALTGVLDPEQDGVDE